MLLAVDMGNTNIVVGCVKNTKILFEERISTDISKTELEYAIILKNIFDIHDVEREMIEGAIISSVVPPLTGVLQNAVKKICGISPMVVGPGIKTGLNLLMDDPKSIGADLIVDAVAGIAGYGAPLILIDMGTATTITVIDRNGNYTGGMIMPGVRASLGALVKDTSQLPAISLESPGQVIGKNTIDAMKSGIIIGAACMIDGMIDRIEREIGYECRVVATGGLSTAVVPLCNHEITIDDELLLKGLDIIYRKNVKKTM